MSDLAKWIHMRLGNGRRANGQPFANEGRGVTIDTLIAKRANYRVPGGRSGAGRNMCDPESQISCADLDLPWPAFPEDGLLRIDAEARELVEIRFGIEQQTGPPLQDEKA